ncbi:hypothetical protein EUX98_g2017 [Antrodiella citrinella]|uniref:EKC/KEOPS complex subunit CGI121 n=1 Tax=Antrodiella citrinella TaxID=2447956 RepID=A0A4S4N026_9APHY|nr:hypothetical protein EUX98_g2017 [Antrodiella citrinella]
MESFTYSHFPADVSSVHVALFTNVSNSAQLKQRLISAASMLGLEGEEERAVVNFAFIDARLVRFLVHLQTAIYQAILAHLQGALRTRTDIASTLLSTAQKVALQISDAIRRYGVSETTKYLILVRIGDPEDATVEKQMTNIVEGDLSSLSSLQDIADWGLIRKARLLDLFSSSSPTPSSSRRLLARKYSTPTPEGSKTRDRAAVGVFTPKAAGLFVATGLALFAYFKYEKERLHEQRQKQLEDQQVGRPNVGGPLNLLTHQGKPFTEQDLVGHWSLVYFGFTNCPDICPEELDKMSAAVEKLDKEYGEVVQPIFISVDPARDSQSQIARYVADFHPRLLGLYGDYAATKAACKSYRVYFSTPPDAKATDDYLVDHSIFFYFMDPNGKFVDAFGKVTTEEDVIARVKKEITSWKDRTGKIV